MNQIIDLSDLQRKITNNKRHLLTSQDKKIWPFLWRKRYAWMDESDSAMFGAQQYFMSKGKPGGRVRVIGDLTVSLLADLHGYFLLKQKAL